MRKILFFFAACVLIAACNNKAADTTTAKTDTTATTGEPKPTPPTEFADEKYMAVGKKMNEQFTSGNMDE